MKKFTCLVSAAIIVSSLFATNGLSRDVQELREAAKSKLDSDGYYYHYSESGFVLEDFANSAPQYYSELAKEVDLSEFGDLKPFFDNLPAISRITGLADFFSWGVSEKEFGDGIIVKSVYMLNQKRRGIWTMFGDEPSERRSLDFLSPDTVLLIDFDLSVDTPIEIVREVGSLFRDDFGELMYRETSEALLGDKHLLEVAKTIRGEVALSLAIDEDNPIEIPVSSQAVTIGFPSITVYLEARGDLLFDSIGKELTKKGVEFSEEEIGDYSVVTLIQQAPFPPLPLIAWNGEHLIVSTNKLEMKKRFAGEELPTIHDRTDFASIVSTLPTESNSLVWVSPALSNLGIEVLEKIQEEEALPKKFNEMLFRLPPMAAAHVNGTDHIYKEIVMEEDPGLFLQYLGFGKSSSVATIGVLVAIAVPNFVRAREISRRNACQENQAKIDGAKQQWALENNMPADAQPTWDDLVGRSKYLRTTPVCPAGGEYTINPVNDDPSCSLRNQPQFPHTFPLAAQY